MKHHFEIGSDVLCFEPDPNKEKLIYQARISNHNGHENSNKKAVPLYLVHFIGWNKKWDRVVSENFLMTPNAFNLSLKLKIDEIAKNEKRHALRHDLIDEVLEIASNVDDQNEFNWNYIDEEIEKLRSKAKANKICKNDSCSNEVESVAEYDSWKEQNLEKPTSDNFDAVSDGEKSLISRENDMIHMTFCPKINLSSSQMAILELDQRISSMKFFSTVNTIRDIHDHALSPCVIDILQMYLDLVPHCDLRVPGWKEFERFCDMDLDGGIDATDPPTFSFLDSCYDTANRRPMKLPQWPDSDLSASYQRADVSTQLCFEICSGLRVLFDSYVRSCLLYEKEWSRHDSMVSFCDPRPGSEKLRPIYSQSSLKLVPDEFRHHNFGFQPSLYYGYAHLLRLLHEMPRILVRMSLTRASLAVVLRHCFCLIKYLDMHYKDYEPALHYPPAVSTSTVTRKKPAISSRVSATSVAPSPRRSLRSETRKSGPDGVAKSEEKRKRMSSRSRP